MIYQKPLTLYILQTQNRISGSAPRRRLLRRHNQQIVITTSFATCQISCFLNMTGNFWAPGVQLWFWNKLWTSCFCNTVKNPIYKNLFVKTEEVKRAEKFDKHPFLSIYWRAWLGSHRFMKEVIINTALKWQEREQEKEMGNTCSLPINCLVIWSSVLVGSHVLETFMQTSSREHDTLFRRLTHTPATANEIMSTFYEYSECFC